MPSESLDDYTFEVEALVAGSKDDDVVGIDPDKRAYHMFIKSGLTNDKINHIFGFVYDPDEEEPSATLDPQKIQETVLRFLRQTMGSWTDTVTPERLWAGIHDLSWRMRQRRTDIRRRIIPGPGLATRAATRKTPKKKLPD